MDLRKSLLKVAIGIAMLVVVGSFYGNREAPENAAPHVFLVSVSHPLSIDDLRASLSEFNVRVKPAQPSQEDRHLVEVIAPKHDTELEGHLIRMTGIRIVESSERQKAQ